MAAVAVAVAGMTQVGSDITTHLPLLDPDAHSYAATRRKAFQRTD